MMYSNCMADIAVAYQMLSRCSTRQMYRYFLESVGLVLAINHWRETHKWFLALRAELLATLP